MKTIYIKQYKKIIFSIDRYSNTLVGIELHRMANITAFMIGFARFQITISYVAG